MMSLVPLISLLGTILSIGFFFVATKFLDFDAIDMTIVSLGLMFISFSVQRATRHYTEDKKSERLEEFLDEAVKKQHLLYEGSVGKFEKSQWSKFENVAFVRNTCVGLSENIGDGQAAKHTKKIYEVWFRNGHDGKWEDVISHNYCNDLRFNTSEYEVKAKKIHEVFALDSEVPFINFVILEDFQGERNVYFGWNPSQSRDEYLRSFIFSSRDPNLIETFEETFRKLKLASTRMQYQEGRQ